MSNILFVEFVEDAYVKCVVGERNHLNLRVDEYNAIVSEYEDAIPHLNPAVIQVAGRAYRTKECGNPCWGEVFLPSLLADLLVRSKAYRRYHGHLTTWNDALRSAEDVLKPVDIIEFNGRTYA